MAQDREPFLRRWSRRKLDEAEARAKPVQPAESPPPELPPIDSLTPESDYSGFMNKQVDEKLRRAALRRLFSDPSFNVADGLDEYAEDFTQLEALAEGAAAGLQHARRTLLGRDPDAPAPTEEAAAAATDAEPAQDAPAQLANERDDGAAEDEARRNVAAVPAPADAAGQKKA